MSIVTKAMMQGVAGTAAANASGGLSIEDLFSTALYDGTGNGNQLKIKNGIQLGSQRPFSVINSDNSILKYARGVCSTGRYVVYKVEPSQNILVKLDNNNQIVWQKSLGTTGYSISDLECNDNHVFAVYNHTHNGRMSALVIIYDKDGNIIAEKIIGSNTYGLGDIRITGSPTHVYLAFSEAAANPVIVKLDYNLNVAWQKMYNSATGSYTESYFQAIQWSPAGLLLGVKLKVSSSQMDNDVFSINENDGAILWKKKHYTGYGSTSNKITRFIVNGNDGYLFGGVWGSMSGSNGKFSYIAKFNMSNGGRIDRISVSGNSTQPTGNSDIHEATTDGSNLYVITSDNGNNGAAALVKLDANLNRMKATAITKDGIFASPRNLCYHNSKIYLSSPDHRWLGELELDPSDSNWVEDGSVNGWELSRSNCTSSNNHANTVSFTDSASVTIGNAGRISASSFTSTNVATNLVSSSPISVDASDGFGGMVITKQRLQSGGSNNFVHDTERSPESSSPASLRLATNWEDKEYPDNNYITHWNSDGYSISGALNEALSGSQGQFVSWTFRKAPKFFDMVTYDGTGNPLTISHNLGSIPGVIIIKRRNASSHWNIWHRGNGGTYGYEGYLNQSGVLGQNNSPISNVTSDSFTVAGRLDTNDSGFSYIAYIFAHNDGDGEFGPTGDQDIIKCGMYDGVDSNSGPIIDLGWEPQFVLIKIINDSGHWLLFDTYRGIPFRNDGTVLTSSSSAKATLLNDSAIESSTDGIWSLNIHPNGFQPTKDQVQINQNGYSYIYMAIRKGAMKRPTSGSDVFAINYLSSGSGAGNVNFDVGLSPDVLISKKDTREWGWYDKSRGYNKVMELAWGDATSITEVHDDSGRLDSFNHRGYKVGSNGGYLNRASVNYLLRRSQGFFESINYIGNGGSGYRILNHNLGTVPEFMIWKHYSSNEHITGVGWEVYHKSLDTILGAGKSVRLNRQEVFGSLWGVNPVTDAWPTRISFPASMDLNFPNKFYFIYLFATMKGVSHIGHYAGDANNSINIDCEFTNGARFVLIKNVNSAEDWVVHDSETGITAGSEYHYLFRTDNKVNSDLLSPLSSGFTVNPNIGQVGANRVNKTGDSFIYLAIS